MKENRLSIQTNNNTSVPAIADAKSLAAIRLDERRFPRYKNIPAPKRAEWMTSEIKVLASIARLRDFDVKEAVMMATILDEMMLRERFISELTLPEIHDAFKNGVFGIYGDFYGISAPNLYGYLEAFLGDERKKEAARIVRERKAKEEEARKLRERLAEQGRIRAEIERAKADGSFVPTRGYDGLRLQTVDEALAEDGAHARKVRQQARDILAGRVKI